MGARAAEKLLSAQKAADSASILQALCGGLSQVWSRELGGGAAGELPAGEVVDAEIMEEEEGL